jgi:hypothetical protein
VTRREVTPERRAAILERDAEVRRRALDHVDAVPRAARRYGWTLTPLDTVAHQLERALCENA